MKFDQNGNRIGTAPKTEATSSTPYTQGIQSEMAHTKPETPFTVDFGITPQSWGLTTERGILIDVYEIVESCADFNRYYPEDFPLEESIIDGISEASTHELTHFIGHLEHNGKTGLTLPDFYSVLANMGHPIKMKMLERADGYDPVKDSVIKAVTCIDLPDQEQEPEIPFEAPKPKEPFSTFQVGNMVLKVRNS